MPTPLDDVGSCVLSREMLYMAVPPMLDAPGLSPAASLMTGRRELLVDELVDNFSQPGDNLSTPVDELGHPRGISIRGLVADCRSLPAAIDISHATRNGDPRSMNTGDLEFAKAGTGPSVSDMGRLTGKPPLEGAVRGGRVRVDRSLPRLCQATVARSADSSDRAIGPSKPRNTRGPFHLIHGRGLYLCLRSIMHIDLPGHTRHACIVHG